MYNSMTAEAVRSHSVQFTLSNNPTITHLKPTGLKRPDRP
ncbi:hypothetical protein 9081_00158 [Pseudomonas phage bmx-p3]|nr:hypothetical protein 9081_00158 [Pseudomonas phage bmx-p3]